MSKLSVAQNYAVTFVGLPYIWGGSHPSQGYDCSGLVQEILAGVGLDPPGDQTAQSLYAELLKNATLESPKPGGILFFGSSLENITHVAFALDSEHMIEAGGGDRKTLDKKSAISRGAFVRCRPIKSRKDFLVCLLPRY